MCLCILISSACVWKRHPHPSVRGHDDVCGALASAALFTAGDEWAGLFVFVSLLDLQLVGDLLIVF